MDERYWDRHVRRVVRNLYRSVESELKWESVKETKETEMERRAPHPDMRRRCLVKIVLQCGCQLTARNPPQHNRSKYICPLEYPDRHGYSVMWRSYQIFGSPIEKPNPLVDEDE